MPLSLRRGTVTGIAEQVDGLVRLEVDGAPCIAYPRLTGPVAVGDEVIVNVQANELELGSGGFDILHANLTRGLSLQPEPGSHVMVAPYTSLQHAALHSEESEPLVNSLAGRPVVCCTLHSQLAPVCAGLGEGRLVAYVQLGGGALPVSLSDTVRVLRGRDLLGAAVAAAPCFDGELQCASVAGALSWAAGRGFDAVVCAPGPGIVGTGAQLGYAAVAAAEAANLTTALGGVPVLAARVSEADPRERHRGVSHHTRSVLELSAANITVAWPRGLEAPDWLEQRREVEVDDWREACAGLPLNHMGRGPDEDPWFFAAAFAAGRLAAGIAS